jgi:hypothetical protein
MRFRASYNPLAKRAHLLEQARSDVLCIEGLPCVSSDHVNVCQKHTPSVTKRRGRSCLVVRRHPLFFSLNEVVMKLAEMKNDPALTFENIRHHAYGTPRQGGAWLAHRGDEADGRCPTHGLGAAVPESDVTSLLFLLKGKKKKVHTDVRLPIVGPRSNVKW